MLSFIGNPVQVARVSKQVFLLMSMEEFPKLSSMCLILLLTVPNKKHEHLLYKTFLLKQGLSYMFHGIA